MKKTETSGRLWIQRHRRRIWAARIVASTEARLPGWRNVRRAFLRRLLAAPDLKIGGRVQIETSHPELGGYIKLGRGLEIGRDAQLDISGGLTVEDEVTISEGARIFTHDHVVEDGGKHWRLQGKAALPLRISSMAWIGAGSIVLGAAGEIGQGSVVGAGSVVTRPVGPLSIVAGNPARRIGERTGS